LELSLVTLTFNVMMSSDNKKAQLTQRGTRDSTGCMKAHCEPIPLTDPSYCQLTLDTMILIIHSLR